ncbi:MAG: ABC transporter substrate-binding protein [Vulcanimicrobiaceae bacterium]
MLLGVLLAYLALPSARPAAGDSAPVVFGVELPLAGDDGAAGLEARSAIELAVDDNNAGLAAGTPALRAVVRDAALHLGNPHQDEGTNNAAEPARAAALMHEFAADAGIVAALGGMRPNVAAAEAPVAQAVRLPVETMAALPIPCSRPRPATSWGFSVSGGAQLEALAAARSIDDARGGRFAVLDDGEESRGAVAGCLSTALRTFGGRVVLRASVHPEDETALARLRAAQRRNAIEIVVYVAPAERGTLVCRLHAAESIENTDSLAEMAHRGYDPASVPEGCRWIVRRLAPRSAAYDAFVQRYRERFLEAPSVEAAIAYAATQVLSQAIAAAAPSSGDMRANVRRRLAIGSFDTVLGNIRFGADGAATEAWFDTGGARPPLQIRSQSY